MVLLHKRNDNLFFNTNITNFSNVAEGTTCMNEIIRFVFRNTNLFESYECR